MNKGLMLGGATFSSDEEVETLTPSSLTAKDILLNAGNNTNIKASILKADNSLEINTPNLNISGEYEKANSTNGGTSANIIIGPNGPVGGGIGISYGYSKQGTYIESNLSAPNLVLNSPSQNIDGTIINGQGINPHSDYSEGHQFSGSVGVGNSGLTLGVGLDDYSLFAGGGSSGAFVGAGYREFSLGTGLGKNANGSRTASVFGSAYGFGLDLTRSINNPGITNDHPIWTASAGYGPLSISGDFQHGELKTLSEGFLFWNKSQSINELDTVCFLAGQKVRLIDLSTKNIEEIKIGDSVKSYDEETGKFINAKVLKTFRKWTDKYLEIELENKEIIKVTEEHPFYTEQGWTAAKELKPGSKIKTINGFIQVLNTKLIEERKEVFNFETEKYHTYLIGSDGLVVHNRCVQDKNGNRKTVGNDYALRKGEKFIPRPDDDGYLTFEEARNWWKEGNGEALNVDLGKVDLSRITPKDFPLGIGQKRVFNLLQDKFNTLDDGIVHGSITLKYLGNNRVEIVGNDKYDFDIHQINNWRNLQSVASTTLRNAETVGAQMIHGEGKPFSIYFYGKGRIGK